MARLLQYTMECVNVRTHTATVTVPPYTPRLKLGQCLMHYCSYCNDVTAHEVVSVPDLD